MESVDFAQMFGLKPEECKFHILICAPITPQPNLPHVEFRDPNALRHLPFSDQSFDLVLCPNILFMDAANHDVLAFHQEVLAELSRVGAEVRVLPLVNSVGKPAQYLGSVVQSLQEQGLGVELRQIQLNTGEEANAMLRLWNIACVVK